MANKPFAIQGSDLTLGGVNLSAGTTGIVIPGVTQATNYFVDEVDDRDGSNPDIFGSDTNAVTIIDNAEYLYLVDDGDTASADYVAATYSVDELDDGEIEEINVETEGLFLTADKGRAEAGNMWATTTPTPFVSFNTANWTQIPYRPKMRAGEVENVGGGGNADTGNFSFSEDTISNDNGLTLQTDRGTLAIGTNMETPGVVGHFHIAFEDSNSQPPASDLFFGDDYNYVKLPGSQLNPADHGVEIGTHDRDSGDSHVWRFETDGGLKFPDGTTQTTAYTGQTSSGGTGELYIMANVDGDIVTSTNGIDWTDPQSSGMNGISKVEIHGGVIVYIDHGGEGPPAPGLYYSTQLGTVTLCAGTSISIETGNNLYWNEVHYFSGTDKWVAVGYNEGDNNSYPVLAHSDNGIAWTVVFADNTFVEGFNTGNDDWQLNDVAYLDETNQYVITSALNGALFGGIFVTADITTLLSGINHVAIDADFDEVAPWSVVGFGGPPGYVALMPDTDPDPVWFGYGTVVEDYQEDFQGILADYIRSALGYLPDITEVAYRNGNFIAVTNDGQVITPSFVGGPGGPGFVISIPLPFTNTGISISNTNPAVISWNDGTTEEQTNEKIVVTLAGEYNGTYYVGSGNTLYTDLAMESGLDASGFAAFTSGTVTFSHGEYFDAAGASNSYFYIGNDDEQIFRSSNGIAWTQQADFNGDFFNDFAYGSFVTGNDTTLPYLELTNTPFIIQTADLFGAVTVSTTGTGSGAQVTVVIGAGPAITSVTVASGSNYVVGQRYRINSNQIAGNNYDTDSIDFEVATVDEGMLDTVINAVFTGAATNTPGTYSGVSLEYRASPGDVIDDGVTLVRSYQGALFNIEAETEYDQDTYASPLGTEWNNDGWGNLLNLQSRSYGTLRSALNNNVGNYIVGAELVMHDTINDKYYKFSFSDWGQNGNTGSYAYTRTQVEDPNYFKKTNYGEEVDIIIPDDGEGAGVGITRDNNNGIYNPYREGSWDEDFSPGGTVWNIDGWDDLTNVETRTYDNFYAAYGNGGLGNKVQGSRAVMYVEDNNTYYAVEWTGWTQNAQGGGFSYLRYELDLTQLQEGITFPDGTVLKSAEGIGRVKLTAPGDRRIEEVHGYNEVYVTAIVTTNLTTVASRADTDASYIWIDPTTTTIDDIINTPANYGNAYQFEFSLDNNVWYAWGGGTSGDGGADQGYSVSPLLTYLQGDPVYFRYKTGGDPVVWWNSADLPSGSGNFRGAVIDYHAYTGDATIIGTIHIVDDDGEENITHTEVSSGSTDGENDDLWVVQNEGTISYRRIDGESKTLKIQWTAKVFYGSEYYD